MLGNVTSSLRVNWQGLVTELRHLGDVDLQTFLRETGLELDDIYRRRRGGWTALRRFADLDNRAPGPDDDRLAGAFGRMLHLDDVERLAFLQEKLTADKPPELDTSTRTYRQLLMLHFSLWGANESPSSMTAGFDRLRSDTARREELDQLTTVLRDRIRRVTRPVDAAGRVPLHVHARYSRDEVLAAFGIENPGSVRQGVRWIEDEQADVFFVTLHKTEKHYSPTTMYQDRAITPSLFQWESQSTTSEASPTGQRYLHHRDRGSSIHLFIRETKEPDGALGAPPYVYAGPASYVRHEGDRPIRILWKLDLATG